MHRAKDAVPLVADIYRYHDEHGLWPYRLTDVTQDPSFLEWSYYWPGYDGETGPSLWLHGPLHMRLEYQFPLVPSSPSEGWRARCEGDPLTVNVEQEIPVAPMIPPDELNRRILEELHRRIQVDPENQDHRDALEHFEHLHEGIESK